MLLCDTILELQLIFFSDLSADHFLHYYFPKIEIMNSFPPFTKFGTKCWAIKPSFLTKTEPLMDTLFSACWQLTCNFWNHPERCCLNILTFQSSFASVSMFVFIVLQATNFFHIDKSSSKMRNYRFNVTAF